MLVKGVIGFKTHVVPHQSTTMPDYQTASDKFPNLVLNTDITPRSIIDSLRTTRG
jgi:hypothetical protein